MKGMQKIKRGKNFSGVVFYAVKPGIHHNSDPVVIGGNMLSDSANELIAEFNATETLRPDVAKPVWHNALRLLAGESLSNDQWAKIADDYMQRMGFSDTHLRCYVLHDDEAGQHIHIIASRIDLNAGKLYLGRNENLISTRIINELEIAHALTVTKTAVSPEQSKKKRVSRNEKMLAERTGKPSPKEALQRLIDEFLIDKPDLKTFLHRLEQKDVQWTANIATTGRMSGFSFSFQGIAFKASQLGKAYSWKNLQERIRFNSETDTAYLLSVKSGAASEKIFSVSNPFMELSINPADSLVAPPSKQNCRKTAHEAISIGEAITALSKKIETLKASQGRYRSSASLQLSEPVPGTPLREHYLNEKFVFAFKPFRAIYAILLRLPTILSFKNFDRFPVKPAPIKPIKIRM